MAKTLAVVVGAILTVLLTAGIVAQTELRCGFGTFKDGTHYLSCEHGITCWVEDRDCTVLP